MSFFEIGRAIEGLTQRVISLEGKHDNRDKNEKCSCNDEEHFEIDGDDIAKNSVRLISTAISESHVLKILVVNSGDQLDKHLISNNPQVFTTTPGNFRYSIFIHPIKNFFDFGEYFPNSFSGLGNGRTSCKRGLPRCRSTRYDQDCVDMVAYFNRADHHCDYTCATYHSDWLYDPNC